MVSKRSLGKSSIALLIGVSMYAFSKRNVMYFFNASLLTTSFCTAFVQANGLHDKSAPDEALLSCAAADALSKLSCSLRAGFSALERLLDATPARACVAGLHRHRHRHHHHVHGGPCAFLENWPSAWTRGFALGLVGVAADHRCR